jgi:hypothetical protein
MRRKLAALGVLGTALVIGVVAGLAQASHASPPANAQSGALPVHHFAKQSAAAPLAPLGSQVIFSNLGPGGAYASEGWCVTDINALVIPPDSCGYPYTTANAFTGNGGRVTQIDLGLVYDGGTNNATVSLAADDGFGEPGQILGSWPVANQPPYHSCCSLTTVHVSPSMPVGAGRTYWVIVSPGPNANQDTSDVWDANYYGDFGYFAQSQDGGATWSTYYGGQSAFDVIGCSKLCKVT